MNKAYIASFACAGILAVGLAAALPLGASPQDGPVMYGVAVVQHMDADGKVLSTQTIHNQLLDAGEQHILQQAFAEGTTVADNVQVGAICLSADDTAPTENMTHTAFNTNADADDNASSSAVNCKTDDSVDLATTAGAAVVGPLTFDVGTAATNNWYNGDTPRQIGICAADSGDADVRGCTAPLFATVALTGTTALATGESLTVTYTFNIASPAS